MERSLSVRPGDPLRAGSPRARITALADPGSVEWLDSPRPSPNLARFGIAAQEDDGVVTARLRVRGQTWLAAAQDEGFLRGSVGPAHGDALRGLFVRACAERPQGVALLAASGGVRLHEANAGELALGRALHGLVDVRAAGIRTAAVAVGDVFGGASVLACAAGRMGALPGVRIGLSGPKVIEVARGRAELDARDAALVDAIYGREARVRHGMVEAVDGRPDDVAVWLAQIGEPQPFERAVIARQAILANALAPTRPATASVAAPAALPQGWEAMHVAGRLWRTAQAWIVAPWGDQAVDARSVSALDDALLAHVGVDDGPHVLVLLEDSPGHEVARAAEMQLLSRYLAHHACVLGVMRMRGVSLVGALLGTGHSAAFFANALQADRLCAAADAQVVAMAPDAIARVTGVDAARLVADDPLLGHPVRHFAALGGVDALLPDASQAAVLNFALAG